MENKKDVSENKEDYLIGFIDSIKDDEFKEKVLNILKESKNKEEKIEEEIVPTILIEGKEVPLDTDVILIKGDEIPEEVKKLKNLNRLIANNIEILPEWVPNLKELFADNLKTISSKHTNLLKISANSLEKLPSEFKNLKYISANNLKEVSGNYKDLIILYANNADIISKELENLMSISSKNNYDKSDFPKLFSMIDAETGGIKYLD